MPADAGQLAEELIGRLREAPGRYLLGLTGIPGSGKSTLAARLQDAIAERLGPDRSAVVAMDGFHWPNRVLEMRNLVGRKGSPPTFDAAAFAELLRRLREVPPETVMAPVYDRRLHAPVSDAIEIGPRVELVIVEGNYLLLSEGPWAAIRGLLDQVWFIDIPLEMSMQRVRDRHIAGGMAPDAADAKVAANDRLNAELILSTRSLADETITADV